jgi:hypothetical protein
MKFKTIPFKGINRMPGELVENGFCDELTNLRHKNGVLKCVGYKQPSAYSTPTGTWDYMAVHQMDTLTNLIGHNADGKVYLILTSGATTIIKDYGVTVTDLRISTMKRFLIVIGTGIYDVFLWSGTQYNLITIPGEPELLFGLTSASPINQNTAPVSTAEALLGAYFDSLDTQSRDNYAHGSIALRLAYKMYDESYIFHTLPKILFCNPTTLYQINKLTASTYSITHTTRKVSVISPSNSMYDGIDKNIITSVCIFASKMEDYYKIDEETITTTLLAGLTVTSHTFASMNIAKNVDYSNLSDSPSWYLVKEIPLTSLQNLPSYNSYNEFLDLTDFYQDYATRQTLPVDSFSHQKITGYAHFNYNSRLLLGKVTTIFESLDLINADAPAGSYFNHASINGYIRTIINTDSGERAIYQAHYFDKIKQSGGNIYLFFSGYANGISEFLPSGVIGYPDSRAIRIEILLNTGGNNYFLFGSIPLTKSKYDNFAYYKTTDFGTISLTNTVVTGSNDEVIGSTTLNNTLEDYNRVQVSELSNPLVFHAENSYQVGSGSIIAICAASVPLSSGQFGQYPVHIFTSKGRYAMLQGSGDVLFSSVTPTGPEVANNRDNVISLVGGILFSTVDGLYTVFGDKVNDIGRIMYGIPDNTLKSFSNAHLHYFLNTPVLSQLEDSISFLDFETYLETSKICYDRVYNELIITNSTWADYSYMFNFDAGEWYKIPYSYKLLINNYPECWGYDPDLPKIMNLSLEEYTDLQPVLIITRPIKLEADGVFSLIHRLFLRCFVDSALHSGLYVWGSNDMLTWQLLQGIQRTSELRDFRLTRSHCKVKYYVIVFHSQMNKDSHIGNMDIQYYNKLTNKLR